MIAFEKRHRIADIFAKVAEYTAAIVILGSLVSKESNLTIIVAGTIMFVILFLMSILAEPAKEVG